LTTKVVKQITRDLQRVRQQYGLPQLPRGVARTNREIESPVLIRIPRSLPQSIVKKRLVRRPRRGGGPDIEIEIGDMRGERQSMRTFRAPLAWDHYSSLR